MRTVEQLRFRAMGSEVHVVVVGGPLGLARDAQQRIAALESRWSRFRPTSDVSTANALAGEPVRVHPDTIVLFTRAIDAWRRTDGRFDPTVHDSLVACGYDRTFADVPAVAPLDPQPHVVAAAGCAAIVVDEDAALVTLPAGVHVDFGGIGKGLAADLVVDELRAAGATGVLCNVGGDIRASGESPRHDSWTIEVEDPFDISRTFALVALASGGDIAVATSSTLGRRWLLRDRWFHHLIDPATGAPSCSGIVAVTVLAKRAWLADVATKVVLDGAPWPTALGEPLPSLVFHADGHHDERHGIARYLHAELACRS